MTTPTTPSAGTSAVETAAPATPELETLAQFNLAETDEGYVLEIGGDAGSLLTLAASADQLGAILEALDALLAPDDDAPDA